MKKSVKKIGKVHRNLEGTDKHQFSGEQDEQIHYDLVEVERSLRKHFDMCSDVTFRTIDAREDTRFLLVFVNGMVDAKTLDDELLKPLIFFDVLQSRDDVHSLKDVIQKRLLPVAQTETIHTISEAIDRILKASVAIFLDGACIALTVDMSCCRLLRIMDFLRFLKGQVLLLLNSEKYHSGYLALVPFMTVSKNVIVSATTGLFFASVTILLATIMVLGTFGPNL